MTSSSQPIVHKLNPLSRKRIIARSEDTPATANVAVQEPAGAVVEGEHNNDMSPPTVPAQQRSTKPVFDIVEATSAVASRPQTPSSAQVSLQHQQQQQASAAERGLLRGSIDEKKLYSGYRSQTEKWLALAHIGQNFITISMRAETAVDFAREAQQQ